MIYAVSPIIQKKEVTETCFGKCKKLSIGGIDLGDHGPFVPCRHDDCEYEAEKTPIIGNVFGEEVCIRKLKSTAERK